MLIQMSAASADSVDASRLEAARLRVEQKWTIAGYDRLALYDRAKLDQLRQEGRSENVINEIARILDTNNPGKTEAVLAYLNETLLPFVASFKAQYLCFETENYYNFNLSTEEITRVPELDGPSFSDYGIWLAETEVVAKEHGLAIPASYRAIIDDVKSRGFRLKRNTVRLDCGQEQSWRLQTMEIMSYV